MTPSPAGCTDAPRGPRGARGPENPEELQGCPRRPLGLRAPGYLGPEAPRAGGPGKQQIAITRTVFERFGLSKGCGLAVLNEAAPRSARPPW